MKNLRSKVLFAAFAAGYLICFCYLLDFIYNHFVPWTAVTDVLTIPCYIAAFIASVGLSEYTVKRIEYRLENRN